MPIHNLPSVIPDMSRLSSSSSSRSVPSAPDVAIERQTPGAPAGKVAPALPDGDASAAAGSEELSATVSRLNDYARNLSRDLEFTLDKELNRVIVRVYDAETEELIRQIPSEEVLSLARRLARDEGVIVDARA